MNTKISATMFEKAKHEIAGGVGSIARSVGAGFRPFPVFMKHGKGPLITDVDGNEYIDYLLAFGPLILGHRPARIMDLVIQTLTEAGSMFGMPHELEFEAAKLLTKAVPSVDLVRFGNSGSEAVMSALRLARAYTGKEKIIRFEGMYHGWVDVIHFSSSPPVAAAGLERSPRALPASPGIPECLAETLIVQPWNNFEVLEETIRNRKHEIAAIITEPIMGNTGCILPKTGYLEFLRDITSENDILLIFDEVITGFRLGLRGAQGYYEIAPDLTTFGKALGAGFPVAAFGGKEDIMKLVASNQVVHSGTNNSSPLVMAAVKATLTAMNEEEGMFNHLHEIGDALKSGLETTIRELGIPVVGQGLGPMFQIWFSDHPITDYREAVDCSRPEQYSAFYQAMLRRGILFHPSQFETWFVSTEHTKSELDSTLAAAEEAILEAKGMF